LLKGLTLPGNPKGTNLVRGGYKKTLLENIQDWVERKWSRRQGQTSLGHVLVGGRGLRLGGPLPHLKIKSLKGEWGGGG